MKFGLKSYQASTVCVVMQCSLSLHWIKSYPGSSSRVSASGTVPAHAAVVVLRDPEPSAFWHLFGFKAECGTGWQLVLESVCSYLGCLSCPSDQFRGEQTHCGFQPTSLCSVWYEKLWSSAHSKKMGSNSSLMMKELSLFMWVGLALIKFIAWSYRHLEFNKDNTMKTMEFLTI